MEAEVEKGDGEAVSAAASEAEAAGESSAVVVAQAGSAEQPVKQKVQYGLSKFFNPAGQSEHKPVLVELQKRQVGRPPKVTPAMLKALEAEKAELQRGLEELKAQKAVSSVVCSAQGQWGKFGGRPHTELVERRRSGSGGSGELGTDRSSNRKQLGEKVKRRI